MSNVAESLLFTDASELTGAQRSAVLLMYLEPESVGQVIGHLDAAELEEIGAAMAMLEAIPPHVIEQVVATFVKDLREMALIPRPGREFALGILPGLIDESRRTRVMSNLKRRVSRDFADFCATRPPETIATVLRDEHPQTQAIALLVMGTENAARVLNCMDEHERYDLCMRMINVRRVPNEIAEDVESAVTRALEGGARHWDASGIDLAAQTIGHLSKRSRDPLLERIEGENEDLSKLLRRRMMPFDHLATLEDVSIQTLMRHVDRDRLSLALRIADPAVRARFLKNMSKRAAKDLREELDLPSSHAPAEMRRAKEEIVQTALRLQEQGILRLGLGEDDDEDEAAAK